MRPTDLLLLTRIRAASQSGATREVRAAAQLSLAEVAAACGAAPSTVSRWERGLQAPHGQAGLKYARLITRLEHAQHQVEASAG